MRTVQKQKEILNSNVKEVEAAVKKDSSIKSAKNNCAGRTKIHQLKNKW